VDRDGDVNYVNGDHTEIPAPKSRCWRKMKHIWGGCLCVDLPLVCVADFTPHRCSGVAGITYCSGSSWRLSTRTRPSVTWFAGLRRARPRGAPRSARSVTKSLPNTTWVCFAGLGRVAHCHFPDASSSLYEHVEDECAVQLCAAVFAPCRKNFFRGRYARTRAEKVTLHLRCVQVSTLIEAFRRRRSIVAGATPRLLP